MVKVVTSKLTQVADDPWLKALSTRLIITSHAALARHHTHDSSSLISYMYFSISLVIILIPWILFC